MDQSLSKYEWLSDIGDIKLYKNLILQVKKDFELTGLNIDIDAKTLPNDLIENISKELYNLISYKFDTYMQLLYRIDLSEQLMQFDAIESAEVLAEKATLQLLKREWQKVEWREKFK